MHYWLALTLSVVMVACATNTTVPTTPPETIPAEGSGGPGHKPAVTSAQPVKSPHGYVINGPKNRFGGFVGDCSSDENFPYYWECQRENAGDSRH